jgi:hypothetical protein
VRAREHIPAKTPISRAFRDIRQAHPAETVILTTFLVIMVIKMGLSF